MKNVTGAIVAYLKADMAITALVSTRVYRGKLPPSVTLPAICVTKPTIPARPIKSHNGLKTTTTRVQCTSYTSTDEAADNLSELIADTLLKVRERHLTLGVYVIRVDDGGGTTDRLTELENTDDEIWLYHHDLIVEHNV
jgi:hypothetical protein